MKKKYSSPYLAVESFQLDAAIAGSCGVPINHYDDDHTCGYGIGQKDDEGNGTSKQYWGEDWCTIDVVNPRNGENNKNCYHGPMSFTGGTFLYS